MKSISLEDMHINEKVMNVKIIYVKSFHLTFNISNVIKIKTLQEAFNYINITCNNLNVGKI